MTLHRDVFDAEHRGFRQSVSRFIDSSVAPRFEAWEAASIVDRDFWDLAGKASILCPQVPEADGGTGDFRYNAVVIEEMSYAGFAGPAANLTAHSDVACGYVSAFAQAEVRSRWLPAMMSGSAVCAIAMTEPAAGSDLRGLRSRAVLDGDHYVLNGAKTFISNGQHCDIALVAARTDTDGKDGLSLFLVEADSPGFEKGRNLEKLGQHSADTSELSFVDVRVPVVNLLGEEAQALGYMMKMLPTERLIIAIASMAAAQKAFDLTRSYVSTRQAFGKHIGTMQNTRFALADIKADLAVGWAYIDSCLTRMSAGTLDTEQASVAKLWVTEMHGRTVDRCLQFFGGYGYMKEYEICRLYADARVQRIYGGTSEIMREVIARTL